MSEIRTTSGVAHCHVCCDDKFLEEFRVLRCGHCFCAVCMAELKARGSACPVCRRPIEAENDGPIFITLVNTNVAKATCLVEELYKMDKNTEEEKVMKAGERIKEVLEESTEAESDVLRLLWNAMEDFKTRIAAFCASSKNQANKILTLEKQLAFARRETVDLSRNLKKARSLEHEHKKLQLRVEDAERHVEAALTLAERAKDDAIKPREEVEKLKKALERERVGKQESQQENKQLKGWLDDHAKMRGVHREKMRALRKEVNQLRLGVEARSTIDDTLVIVDDERYESDLVTGPTSSAHSPSLFSSEITPPSSPSFPHVLAVIPQNDFECLPGPRRFKGPWPPPGNQANLDAQLKRKREIDSSFPISVDKNGHVKGNVQCGPKRRPRVRM